MNRHRVDTHPKVIFLGLPLAFLCLSEKWASSSSTMISSHRRSSELCFECVVEEVVVIECPASGVSMAQRVERRGVFTARRCARVRHPLVSQYSPSALSPVVEHEEMDAFCWCNADDGSWPDGHRTVMSMGAPPLESWPSEAMPSSCEGVDCGVIVAIDLVGEPTSEMVPIAGVAMRGETSFFGDGSA